MTDRAGPVLAGRNTLERVLGRGGMATIHLGRHRGPPWPFPHPATPRFGRICALLPAAAMQAVRDSITRGVMATLRRQARARPTPAAIPDAYLAVLHGSAALAPDSVEVRALLARMRALADARHVSPYALALVHAAVGETRPALDALHRALRERDPAVLDLPLDPRRVSLRRDPCAAGLVRRLEPDYNPPTSTPRPPAPGL